MSMSIYSSDMASEGMDSLSGYFACLSPSDVLWYHWVVLGVGGAVAYSPPGG